MMEVEETHSDKEANRAKQTHLESCTPLKICLTLWHLNKIQSKQHYSQAAVNGLLSIVIKIEGEQK